MTKWIVVYDDPDRNILFFEGAGAEEAAKKAHREMCQNWTCELYLSAADLSRTPSTSEGATAVTDAREAGPARPANPDVQIVGRPSIPEIEPPAGAGTLRHNVHSLVLEIFDWLDWPGDSNEAREAEERILSLATHATPPSVWPLTPSDLERWDALARDAAKLLAIGDDAQVLAILKTGLAQAYKLGCAGTVSTALNAIEVGVLLTGRFGVSSVTGDDDIAWLTDQLNKLIACKEGAQEGRADGQ